MRIKNKKDIKRCLTKYQNKEDIVISILCQETKDHIISYNIFYLKDENHCKLIDNGKVGQISKGLKTTLTVSREDSNSGFRPLKCKVHSSLKRTELLNTIFDTKNDLQSRLMYYKIFSLANKNLKLKPWELS